MTELKETQSRWKSKLMWAAIITQLVVLGELTGFFSAIGINSGLVGDIAAAVLQLAVIVGLVNDPTNPTGW